MLDFGRIPLDWATPKNKIRASRWRLSAVALVTVTPARNQISWTKVQYQFQSTNDNFTKMTIFVLISMEHLYYLDTSAKDLATFHIRIQTDG